jgi:hypothetical protein
MSKKLQVQIQDIKRIPGKHKRVLLALASHARNDGTNIWASKETIGHGAGVSRWTVYRNLDDLLAVGVLVEADSHTCKNPECNGAYHYMVNGHYTRAYNINVAMLQNATKLINELRSKMRHGQCSKMPKTHVAKRDANQGVSPSVETGEKTESSALTSGVSLLASPLDQTLPPVAPVVLEQEKENQPLYGDELLAEQEPQVKTIANLILDDSSISMLLGNRYWSTDDIVHAVSMAKRLRSYGRSTDWLKALVKWMKLDPFWKKRLHAGVRAVGQLAKHLDNQEVAAQFDQHLVLTLGDEALDEKSTYSRNWYAEKARAEAAAVAGECNVQDNSLCAQFDHPNTPHACNVDGELLAMHAGFNPEDAN